jgi:hypothetical protein
MQIFLSHGMHACRSCVSVSPLFVHSGFMRFDSPMVSDIPHRWEWETVVAQWKVMTHLTSKKQFILFTSAYINLIRFHSLSMLVSARYGANYSSSKTGATYLDSTIMRWVQVGLHMHARMQ